MPSEGRRTAAAVEKGKDNTSGFHCEEKDCVVHCEGKRRAVFGGLRRIQTGVNDDESREQEEIL